MDPSLVLLQDFLCNGKPMTLRDENGETISEVKNAKTIGFDDLSFPLSHIAFKTESIPTSDEAIKEGKKNNDDSTTDDTTQAKGYSLQSLLFLLQYNNEEYGVYFAECLKARIPFVSLIDKKKILDYLTGATDVLMQGDGTAPVEKKRTSDDIVADEKQPALKKTRTTWSGKTYTKEKIKQLMGREITIQTRTKILTNEKKSFENIQQAGQELFLKSSSNRPNRPDGPTTNQPAKVPAPLNDSKKKSLSKYVKQPPIIIVPAAATSLVNIYNVKEFLENGRFVDPLKARESTSEKRSFAEISKKQDPALPQIFHAVDSVSKFSSSDWERVVAVFATGALWQFKGWKWQDHNELFRHVKGFYMKYLDEPDKTSIANWNVKVININRNKRHVDGAVVREFWEGLNKFIMYHKPHLTKMA